MPDQVGAGGSDTPYTSPLTANAPLTRATPVSNSLLRWLRPERAYADGLLRVTDTVAADRIAFFGLTAHDLGVIATWQAACDAHLDTLIDAFYAHVLGHATTRAVLHQHSSVERQRGLLGPYVRQMFEGRVDDRYVQHRRKVGGIHDDIELESNWCVHAPAQPRHRAGSLRARRITPRENRGIARG
jgi:hypothetical protein